MIYAKKHNNTIFTNLIKYNKSIDDQLQVWLTLSKVNGDGQTQTQFPLTCWSWKLVLQV